MIPGRLTRAKSLSFRRLAGKNRAWGRARETESRHRRRILVREIPRRDCLSFGIIKVKGSSVGKAQNGEVGGNRLWRARKLSQVRDSPGPHNRQKINRVNFVLEQPQWQPGDGQIS